MFFVSSWISLGFSPCIIFLCTASAFMFLSSSVIFGVLSRKYTSVSNFIILLFSLFFVCHLSGIARMERVVYHIFGIKETPRFILEVWIFVLLAEDSGLEPHPR